MEKLIGINDLAQLLGAKKQTIYKWVHEKYLPFHKIGGMVRFRESEINAWIDQGNKKRSGKGEV